MPHSLAYENIRLRPGQKIGLRHYSLQNKEVLSVDPHFHMMPEIMLFEQVSGTVSINQQAHELKADSLLFIPSMAVHDMHMTAADKAFYLLQFEASVFQDLQMSDFATTGNQAVLAQLTSQEKQWLSSLFDWGCNVSRQLHEQMLQQSILKLILLFIQNRNEVQAASNLHQAVEPHKSMTRMLPLLRYFEDTGKLSISLDEAAAVCGISRYHFSRLFKAFFNMNFKDYILKRKISAAVTLLTGSSMSISEIAYACEFSDTAYFCSKFKAVLQQSPGDFRKYAKASHEF